MRLLFVVILVAASVAAGGQQYIGPPTFDGYVSRVISPSSFELDGRLIELTAEHLPCEAPDLVSPHDLGALALGDHLSVWGRTDRRTGKIRVHRVCDLGWQKEKLDGSATVDGMRRAGTGGSGGKMAAIRGDGRLLGITPSTKVHLESPLRSLEDAGTDDWMRYKAVQQVDGSLVAEEITLAPNVISEREHKLREHGFVDFTPPDPSTGRRGVLRVSHLHRHYPLTADATLQDRLTRVGASVVPAYQKALPASDPVRVNFRFYAIEKLKLSACLSSPDGVIFVPTEVTEHLPRDEQLAAVLATCVADVLEKQNFLSPFKGDSVAITKWTSVGTALFVSGIAGLGGLGIAAYGDHLHWLAIEQSGRVSLDYLQAAGYDPAQSPEVWQILSNKHGRPKPTAEVCPISRYLYQAMAERERSARAAALALSRRPLS